MVYRREIDGLRAIAVLPVILFHAGFSWFSGGYVGVDVFFVISGYLITSILVKDLEKGSFSILRFYERRARRILPALFFVMICCIPFAYAWMIPQQYKDFSQALVAISFFISNILFWVKSGYFSAAAEENPLLHTWSLAVEEQFYIFFPLMLLLLWGFGKKSVFYIVVIISVFSLLLAEWGWRNTPSANFYLLPTRAWELGSGAVCALFLSGCKPSENSILSLLGLAMILYSVFFFTEATPFPSVYTLVPVVGTTLIILFGTNGASAARLLSNKVFVGIGLVSFSAYLWHQPLFAFARIRSAADPSWVLMLALSIVSIVLAFFSWRFVEQPFRSKGLRYSMSRSQIFSYSVAGGVLFLAAGFYGYMGKGLPSREAPSGLTFSELDVGKMTKFPRGVSYKCVSGSESFEMCSTGDDPEVMVWGDSYAKHLLQAIQSSDSFAEKDVVQVTKSACAPIKDLSLTNRSHIQSWSRECIAFNDSVMRWLEGNGSVEYVIMSSPMSIIESSTYDAQGQFRNPSPDIVLSKLNETARYLRSLGKKPVFVSPPPRNGSDLSKCAIYNKVYSRGDGVDCSFAVGDLSSSHVNVIKFLSSEEVSLPVVMLGDYICSNSKCETVMGGVNIFMDDGHLSHEGSKLLGSHFDLFGEVLKVANN